MTDQFETLVQALGPPYCRGERYALYNMDCCAGLPLLPERSIALTVTSPPYNIGKEYERPQPLADYVQWCARWLSLVHHATRDTGALWLNLGYGPVTGKGRAVPLTYVLWQEIPFFLIQEVVWNYGAGVAAKKFLSPRHEKFLWYVKNEKSYTFNLDAIRDPDVKYPDQKKNGKLRCNTIGKNPSDVWQIAKVTSGAERSSKERTPHPAQFPMDLIERIVKGFSNANEIVLDPFMGSGTTAESCLKHGRFAIGFELNRDYCALAASRLKKAESESTSSIQ